MTKYIMAIGDYYNDGHGQYEELHVDINVTFKEFRDALEKSDKDSGMHFQCDVAANYGDGFITPEVHESLKDFGFDALSFDFSGIEDCEEGCELITEDNYHLQSGSVTVSSPTVMAVLVLEWVKMSLPELDYTIEEKPPLLLSNYGYGLFM